MKKLTIALAVVAVAVMASCGNGAPKANLKDNLDTLSYALGMANSYGVKPYMVRQLGMDTAYIDEFIKGLTDGANASDDKKKVAYYAGIQIGLQLTQQFVKSINADLFEDDSTKTISVNNFLAGFVGGVTDNGALMTMDEAQQTAQVKVQEVKEQQLEARYGQWREENEQYLADVAKKEGVKKLTDGVYYRVITEGTGEIPSDTSRVSLHYEGKLINDTVFDSSYKRGEPLSIRTNQVITGWTEALTHMPVGSTWDVYIAADKAYGEREAGIISPFSTLIFHIELLGIVK